MEQFSPSSTWNQAYCLIRSLSQPGLLGGKQISIRLCQAINLLSDTAIFFNYDSTIRKFLEKCSRLLWPRWKKMHYLRYYMSNTAVFLSTFFPSSSVPLPPSIMLSLLPHLHPISLSPHLLSVSLSVVYVLSAGTNP